MNFNLLILGTLFILTLFGVGESIYKKFKISKIFILVCLGLLIAGLYVPNLNIKDMSFSISGFLLPALFTFLFAFKIKSFSFFINLLLACFVCLLLRLCYSELEFVPNLVALVCMGSLGLVLAFVSKEPFSLIVSSFLGFACGNVIFELIKFNSIKIFLSNQLGLSFIFVILIVGIITMYFKTSLSEQLNKQKANQNS